MNFRRRIFVGATVGFVLLASGLVEVAASSLEVIGTPQFSNQVCKALSLLEKKDPEGFQTVTNFIGRIQQGARSGMWAYKVPPTYEMGSNTTFYSVTWCAATIAHDSFHSKLYHEYEKSHPGQVPDNIWTGIEAERACMKHQLAVMERIGAPKGEIDHAKTQADGRYLKGTNGLETWRDYTNRNW
jgi:hypothetical protein